MGTKNGIVRAHTVKRRPDEPTFDKESVLSTTATPMKPIGVKAGHGVSDELVPGEGDMEEIVKCDKLEEIPAARRMMIKTEDIEAAGFTDGCQGCRAVRLRPRSRKHTE